MSGMRILLLGGTGAMGRNLTDILSQREDRVWVTTRTEKKSPGNVHYIVGNAHDNSFLRTLLTEHWDAIVDFMSYTTDEFRERATWLLDATDQYIFLSSARVYADAPAPMVETSPRLLDVSTDKAYLGTDEYALAKARQEDILRESGKKNWTIIRPYITFDTYRLQLGVMEKEAWLYRAMSGRKIVFSSDIAEHVTTMTAGYDAAKAIAATLGQEAAWGETFHIASAEHHSWREFLAVYLEVLEAFSGKKPEVLMTPQSPFLHSGQYYQICFDRRYDRCFDNSKIKALMGEENFSPVLDCLRKSLRDFLENPKFNSMDLKREAMLDRMTGERMRKKDFAATKTWIAYLTYRYFGENISEKVVFRIINFLRGGKA